MDKKIIVLYHGNCPDGFGGAYAAWKKFGDSATYIAQTDRKVFPPEVEGAEVYLIDFSFVPESMKDLESKAARLVVLEHHESAKEMIEQISEHVYDEHRSGATIAWSYFHPDTPIPSLFAHLEDQDLYTFKLPDTVAIHAFLEVHPFTFELWDEVARSLENTNERETFLTRARVYAEYFELLAQVAVDKAKKVSFEGYECMFANVHPFKSLKSRVGNILAAKYPPIALIVSAHPHGYGVSIRGNGTVDVSKIAGKFGGGGHPKSSGFLIPNGDTLPWTLITDPEGFED